MIKHIVMWKFKEEAEGKSRAENIAIVKADLEALKGVIPQITDDFEVGGERHYGRYGLRRGSGFLL